MESFQKIFLNFISTRKEQIRWVINSIYRDSLTRRLIELELLSCIISFEIRIWSNRCASFGWANERNNVLTHFRSVDTFSRHYYFLAELTCLTSTQNRFKIVLCKIVGLIKYPLMISVIYFIKENTRISGIILVRDYPANYSVWTRGSACQRATCERYT